jgi:hypothetical protein
VSDFDLDDGDNAREWFYGGLCRATFSAAGVLSTAMPLTTGVPTSTATAGAMAFDLASNILYYSTSL